MKTHQAAIRRPLLGITIGISISETEDSAGRGFGSADVNRTTRLISESLVAQGARLVFGQDWREGA